MSIFFELTLKQGVDVLRWGNNEDEDILVVAPWCFLIAQKSHDDIFGDHIEARRRCFEMEFNDLFDSPRPGLFVQRREGLRVHDNTRSFQSMTFLLTRR